MRVLLEVCMLDVLFQGSEDKSKGTRWEINTHKKDLLMAIVKATTIYFSYNKAPT